MTEQNDDALAEAWTCVLAARTAAPRQLSALAGRLADALEGDPRCSATILRLAAAHRLAHLLEVLADAAPASGPLYRLAAAVREEQDAMDDCCDEFDEEDDDHEMPA